MRTSFTSRNLRPLPAALTPAGASANLLMFLSRIGPIALEEPLGGSADSNVLRGLNAGGRLSDTVLLAIVTRAA
jgi:hypothetical protein